MEARSPFFKRPPDLLIGRKTLNLSVYLCFGMKHGLQLAIGISICGKMCFYPSKFSDPWKAITRIGPMNTHWDSRLLPQYHDYFATRDLMYNYHRALSLLPASVFTTCSVRMAPDLANKKIYSTRLLKQILTYSAVNHK